MAELHIASCVAYCRPEQTSAVARAIQATGIAEVPRHDGKGRLVVLIEGPSSRQVLDVIEAIRALDGVIAIHLAYQHAESNDSLQEPHA
jgi:nitrate reductase NapD